MAESKLWKYEVVLQRKINGIASTITLVIEATNRRKAVSVAETSLNRSLPSNDSTKATGVGWKTKKASVMDESESSPLRDTD